MYHVYILYSKKLNKNYIGYTPRNIEQRLKEHNQSMNKFTSLGVPWELVWYCTFTEEHKAKSFEIYLKHGSGHAFAKKRLI